MKNRLLEMGIDEENCNKILEMFNKSIEEKDREIADIKLNYEIENVLNSYSVKTNKAVKALLNMEEIKFESLNELFNRLYPAFNTKVCELKKSGINVSEVKLWNYLKENKWSNSKNLTLYDMVSDILNLSKSDFEGEKNDDI